MATLRVEGAIGYTPTAYLIVEGEIGGEFATRAKLVVYGSIWPVRAGVLRVEGSIRAEGWDDVPVDPKVAWSRVTNASALATRFAEGLQAPPTSEITVLGAAPPTPEITFIRGYGDDAGHEERFTTPSPGNLVRAGRVLPPPETGVISADGVALGFDVEIEGEKFRVYEQFPAMESGADDLGNARYTFALTNLPTRKEVAEGAAALAGLGLVWLPGLDAPDPDQLVYPEFTTDGRTAGDVLSEVVLAATGRWWIEDDTLVIHGTTLDANAGSVGPYGTLPMVETHDYDDEPTGDPGPEPNLDDYLNECNPEPEGETGGIFETVTDGEWSYTTAAGAGDDLTETEVRLRKEDSKVVEEETIVRGWRKTSSGANTSRTFSTVTRTLARHTYMEGCGEALVATTEITHRWPSLNDVQGAPSEPLPEAREPGTNDPDDPGQEGAPFWTMTDEQQWFNAMPKPYVEQQRFISQSWNAEGWLQARQETRRSHMGFAFIKTPHSIIDDTFLYQVIPMYKVESRIDRWVPIGKGMWHVMVNESFTEMKTVLGNPDPDLPDDVQPIGVQTSGATHAYTIITDQGPPQVTCGKDKSECEDSNLRKYQFDLENWRSKSRAVRAKRVHRLQSSWPQYEVKRGDVSGGAFLASRQLSWQDGSHAGTSLEVWGYLE
jgi:hypothetical protein